MNAEGFRKLVLSMPMASEGSHMGHPDFRVGGKIFASLPPREGKAKSLGEGDLGMVVLTPEEQAAHVKADPAAFVPGPGAWGARGCTFIVLAGVGQRAAKRAVEAAWRNIAGERAIAELGGKQRGTKRGTGGARVALRRVYEEPSKADGTRVLVERLWPRGLTKEKAAVDVWLKDVSPSPRLRTWYGHDAKKWEEFRRRYREELDVNPAVDELRALGRKGKLTLVYAASDPERSSAAVLLEYLRSDEFAAVRAPAQVSHPAAHPIRRGHPRSGGRRGA